MKHTRIIVLAAVAFGLGAGHAYAGPAEDATLTARVKSALVNSPSARATQVEVDSRDGVVQLKGYVESGDQIAAAATVAGRVEGVTKVENNLKVQGAERSAGVVVDDAMLTARVKSALLADKGTGGLKIDVDTNKGKVQLNGFVDSATERTLAQNLAAEVDGVKSIENNLTVRP